MFAADPRTRPCELRSDLLRSTAKGSISSRRSPVKRLISYPLASGGNVLIEVEEAAAGQVTRGLHPGEVIETVGNSFEAALEAIKPAAVAVASKFRNFIDAPEDIEVEFGLKFAGQAGAFIASASTEAQFRVKMVWKGKPATTAT